jgi:hypothetical protein
MIKKIFFSIIGFYSINCLALEPLDCNSPLSNINILVAKIIKYVCNSDAFNFDTIFIPENYNKKIYPPDPLAEGNFIIFNTTVNKILTPLNFFYTLSSIRDKSYYGLSAILYGAETQKVPKRLWSNYVEQTNPCLISSDTEAVNDYFASSAITKECEYFNEVSTVIIIVFSIAMIATALCSFIYIKYKTKPPSYSNI